MATTPPLTAEQKLAKAKEFLKKQAERMAELEKKQSELVAEVTKAVKAVNDIAPSLELFKHLDIKKLLSDIESIKAGHTQIVRNIQRNSAFKIPGAEDLAGKVSLIKMITAAKTGGKMWGDTQEWELMKQAKEKAAQVIGTGSDGGWFVPDQVIPDVIASIYRKSVLMDLAGDGATRVSVIDGLSGSSVNIPKFKRGCIAYWQGELDDAIVSAATVGQINMKPKKLNCLTRLSEEQQRFGGFGFENLLRQDMIRAMAEKFDMTILTGKGRNDEPEGIQKLGVQRYWAGGTSNHTVAGTNGAVLDWSGLSNIDLLIAQKDLNKDSSFATISNPAWFTYLSQLRVLNFSGQDPATADYLAGLPPLTLARLAELIGPFGTTTGITAGQTINSIAKYTDVYRGNWAEVMVGRWSGIEVVTEDSFNIVNDSRMVKLRMYADIGIRYKDAIVWCSDAQMMD